MTPDSLDRLGLFIQVAQTRSFSAVAKAAGISPSAVSYAIRQLEASLDLRLFNRTTRSVSLTEAGADLLTRLEPLLGGINSVMAEARKSAHEVAGLLRINVPRSASLMLVEPVLRAFLDAYPQVSLEIIIDNGLTDITGQGCDAGIRFGDVLEKDMHVVPLKSDLKVAIVASPDYLRRHGTPLHPVDLEQHECIHFRHVSSGTLYAWRLEKDGEQHQLAVTGRLISNDSILVLQAALDGVGLAYLYEDYVVRHVANGHLVQVLQDWSPSEGLYLYYFNHRGMPPKLRVFIEFLKNAHLPGQLAAPRAQVVAS
ncbi:LysR family transcriptional regulator [Janthinobacterium sp. Mn2066]|uniref:LysR family transcriptional regulator n=1 Tax=Janthinobacterium sp. Mn2066 TaxID=3395264 RepID=UPI003BBF268F